MATGSLPERRGRGKALASDALFEIVDGKKVEVLVGVRELGLATRLLVLINAALGPQAPGEAFVEMLFRLKAGSRKARRPDLAFVTYDRWVDRILPDEEAWEIVPKLMVEIISKSNSAEEVQTKIKEYFEAGVTLVWVIFPRQDQILVYTGVKEVRVLDRNDVLDAPELLPGFSLPVGEFLS